MNKISNILISLIEQYQNKGGGKVWFGVDCNFTPTCSEYIKQSIKRFGWIQGLKLGFNRLRKCNQKDLIHLKQDPVPHRISMPTNHVENN